MTFYFVEEELDNIIFYTQPESAMTPMEKATQASLQLDGFKWEQSRRPLDVGSLRLLKIPAVPARPKAAELDSFGLDVLKVLEGENELPIDMPTKDKPVGSSTEAIESGSGALESSPKKVQKAKVVK